VPWAIPGHSLLPSLLASEDDQIVLEEEYANLSDPQTVEADEQLSKFLRVPHLAVELAPGESLYIPPYWLVRVESIQLSMFLDVRSLSKEQVLLSEAQSLGVLLGKVSTSEEKIVAAQVISTTVEGSSLTRR
jgi:hypothetical protein